MAFLRVCRAMRREDRIALEYAHPLLTHSRALAITIHLMSRGHSSAGKQRTQQTSYATPKRRGHCLHGMMGVHALTGARTSCFSPPRLRFPIAVTQAAKRPKPCVQSHMVRSPWFVLRVSRVVSQKRRGLLALWKSKLLPSAQMEVILTQPCSAFKVTVSTVLILPGATARAGKQNRAIH